MSRFTDALNLPLWSGPQSQPVAPILIGTPMASGDGALPGPAALTALARHLRQHRSAQGGAPYLRKSLLQRAGLQR